MPIPKDFLYTGEHIWLKAEGDQIKIGLTEYALSDIGEILLVELLKIGLTGYGLSDIGEILLVELPEIGKHINAGERFAVIETAKAISDLKSPISGKVIEVNRDLEKEPDIINKEPYEHGWLIRIQKDPSEVLRHLMDFKDYESFLKEEGLSK
jgi:glycine cleavage system H protein